MQVSLGRNWILELTFKLERACSSARRSRSLRRVAPGAPGAVSPQQLRWERDKLRAQMLGRWAERIDG